MTGLMNSTMFFENSSSIRRISPARQENGDCESEWFYYYMKSYINLRKIFSIIMLRSFYGFTH